MRRIVFSVTVPFRSKIDGLEIGIGSSAVSGPEVFIGECEDNEAPSYVQRVMILDERKPLRGCSAPKNGGFSQSARYKVLLDISHANRGFRSLALH